MKDIGQHVKLQFRQRKTIYFLSYSLLIVVGFALCLYPASELPAFSGSVMLAVGASLIAAGFAGCTLFLYVSGTLSDSRRINDILESGIEALFDGRSVAIKDEYDSRLAKASKSIDVLGFGLRHLREDHADHFAEWGRRAKVRFLLVDPEFPSKDSPYADQRDLEEGDDEGKISKDVKQLIKSCSELMGDDGIDFELKLYTCLPSINVFRIDDDVFWGPYFVDDVSRNMPTLLFRGDSFMAKRIARHFEPIWNSPVLSRPVPECWRRDSV